MYDDKTATDDRVTTLFHDTTADVEVDVAALVRGGIVRGRAKHRLHTAGTALAAAVGVAGIVGVALTVAPGPGSGGGSGIAPAGAPAPVPVTDTTAKPDQHESTKPDQPEKKPTAGKSDKPLPPPPATANIPVKAANLPGLFAQIYPGKVTQAEARTGRIIDDGKHGQLAHFLWKGYLTTVSFTAYEGPAAARCEETRQQVNGGGGAPMACTARADGSVLLSGHGQEPAVDGGGKANWASLFTKDSYEIFIQSYTYGRKGGPNLSPQPPLSQTQLKQAVTSQAWF
ncbi:hypothetical protein GCM10029976_081320 [Kribbella albertanoniae]|uniref:Uncharacterized protein n=1 Tax=Kribbella albertanoniae TaxID=1266829 RepID=A0A4V2XQC4_9ACTN|nr:hypothetical protein [Kribbella albertanoniae]TDC25385.1 hypothetical protein E1261_24305 [Kribbella albertanoniae]